LFAKHYKSQTISILSDVERNNQLFPKSSVFFGF
jgi:hypothetical protein